MLAGRATRWLKAHGAWLAYGAAALLCAWYLNDRAQLVLKWGQWYAGDEAPYMELQIRAFLSGHLALVPHPWASERDYFWGRGGMHSFFGLGAPLLATPFHILGRLFGAPGFPDGVRFLICYALVMFVLARALHSVSPDGDRGLAASIGAAGFVMVFPTYVGLISARFLVYDQVESTAALWDLLLLAGLVSLLHKCTPRRLALVCAAAGFAMVIRVHLAAYGFATAVLAMFIAHRKGLRLRDGVVATGAYLTTTGLYFLGNYLRFGGPFNSGYTNCVCAPLANRLTRWGMPFDKTPVATALKEMFFTLFFLGPITSPTGNPPPAVKPYAVAERFREYYSPTYDVFILAAWVLALVFVCVNLYRHKLWRPDRDLSQHVPTVIGLWGVPTSLVLFVFHSRIDNVVTRYATDIFPSVAAACLCTGMTAVDAVRRRAPTWTAPAQLAIAGAVALYIAGWREACLHLAPPTDVKTINAQLAAADARDKTEADLPSHLNCNEDRKRAPVHLHTWGWGPDCHFQSGMNFAMLHKDPCLTFTFGGPWDKTQDDALAEFRVNADFDPLVACGPPVAQGDQRRLTLCEPHPPPFLLDGMRLYTVATLDPSLTPNDRLKLLSVTPAASCTAMP